MYASIFTPCNFNFIWFSFPKIIFPLLEACASKKQARNGKRKKKQIETCFQLPSTAYWWPEKLTHTVQSLTAQIKAE